MFTEAVRGRNVADEVARFRERFQIMDYCFDVDFIEHKNYLAGLF